jgi:hypothetical protein
MGAVLRMSAGAIVWAVHFGVIYGVTAAACARDVASLVPWTVGISGAVAAAALLALLTLPTESEFERWVTGGVAAAALIAVFWETIGAFVVPLCG